MKISLKLLKAIKFATKTHDVYQKQKRKGKDISYIVHPLTTGLCLSQANADEDVVIAGILHDTIEDSVEHKKVTPEMLKERFGQKVADLVMSVTETDKKLSWQERKQIALDDIVSFSKESILVKSADVLSNNYELIDDYARDKDKVFERFEASKEEKIQNTLNVIAALIKNWPENPFREDLDYVAEQFRLMIN
ncbi:MAG: hypothetical protein UT91_C0019G0022 [Parcubacteria group bacterium GW2011_GWA2_40_23]|nr:MAG: hypothetical protein UT91_C0019G0022 [Parcubacteria group bacterium GW2011_GWA2_40_23]